MLYFTILIAVVHLVRSWTRTNDLRIPGELRVANEGLSHDDTYWYMTNQHFIYQVNQNPMTIAMSNHHAISDELIDLGYHHIGDIEVMDGVLYGGIEGGEKGVLAKWNTSTLDIISYKFIDEQSDVPWVTVNPNTGLLYSATWSNVDSVHVYDTKTFEHVDIITIQNNDVYPKEIQGASFYEDYLYVATNINDGIFKLNITTGLAEFVLNDDGNYLPDNYYYEMEGLTFWDLRSTTTTGVNNNKGYGVMHMYGNFMNARKKSIHSFDP